MLSASQPPRLPKPWAAAAGAGYIRPIPTLSQIGVQDGAASLTDGFPPLTFTPLTSGGVPPFGQDENGILNWVTTILQWYQAGGPLIYDATFSTAIGGYPKGCVLQAAALDGRFWRSTVDSNLTNPDAGGAGWASLFAPVFANPTFTGTLTSSGPAVFNSTVGLGASATAATQAVNDSSTKVASTAYADRSATNAYNAAVAWAGTADAAVLSSAEAYTRGVVNGLEQPQGLSVQTVTGSGGGPAAVSLAFDTAVGGVLHVTVSRNQSAVFNVDYAASFSLDGVVTVGDDTYLPQTNIWSSPVGAGHHTLEYSSDGNVQFSIQLSYVFVPFHPAL